MTRSNIHAEERQTLGAKVQNLFAPGDLKPTICIPLLKDMGSTVLKVLATNWMVAGSISASVSGFFADIKSFRTYYVTGVDSASNRNEYQDYFLEVKAAGA